MIGETYINRHLEAVLSNAAETFKVVILGGSRQVGKSTLMKRFLTGKGVRMVSFDNPALKEAAKNDPELFLAQYEPPLMIDEFQYAPELLPFIKMAVDERNGAGLYFLTGSQLFKMMDKVGESLAGRARSWYTRTSPRQSAWTPRPSRRGLAYWRRRGLCSCFTHGRGIR